MTFELTDDEAKILVSLLDLAVKAGGLAAAQAAVPLFQKLQAQAANVAPEQEKAA